MHELRLRGVTDDGGHLVLTANGTDFRLPIDAALRSALRRDHGHSPVGRHDDRPMSPVEVQSLIRGGATAEEVAQRAGWSVDKVHRYEGPILAERQHVARIATSARLRPRGIAAGSPTLLDRVNTRLRERDVSTEEIEWDSWRSDDGQWVVELHFEDNGRHRRAAWSFTKVSMTLAALDDEAARLSDDEPDLFEITSDRGGQRTPSYDQPVDYRGGYAADYASSATPTQPHVDDGSDLMDTLRSTSRARTRRRGARRVTSARTTVTDQDPLLAAEPVEEPVVRPDAEPVEESVNEDGDARGVDTGPNRSAPSSSDLPETPFPADPESEPQQPATPFPADPDSPQDEHPTVEGSEGGSVDEGSHDVASPASPESSSSDAAAVAGSTDPSPDSDAPAIEASEAAPKPDEPAVSAFPVDPESVPHAGASGFPVDPELPTHEEPHLPFESDLSAEESAADQRPTTPAADAAVEPGVAPAADTSAPDTATTSVDASAAAPAEEVRPAPRKRASRRTTKKAAGGRTTKTPTPPAQQSPAADDKPSPPRTSGGKSRRGRASVPAWDDIMFGAKQGDDT